VTREELRDLVNKVCSRTSFPETHVDALKELYDEEQEFIEEAKSNVVSAMKLFPSKLKVYDCNENGFNLISSKVQIEQVGDKTITVIEIYGDHGEAKLLLICGNKSMTARMCRHDDLTDWRDVICYEGDESEMCELFGEDDDYDSFIFDAFSRYGLRYVPE
jgi:hypothetical protein